VERYGTRSSIAPNFKLTHYRQQEIAVWQNMAQKNAAGMPTTEQDQEVMVELRSLDPADPGRPFQHHVVHGRGVVAPEGP